MKDRSVDMNTHTQLVQNKGRYYFWKTFDSGLTAISDESYGSAESAVDAYKNGMVGFKDALRAEDREIDEANERINLKR